MNLNGKPQSDIFLEVAAQLKITPLDCVVFEDALSRIQAAVRGYFWLIIRVARNSNLRKSTQIVKARKERLGS
ncbi:HAD-IA family hydrolase [Coxiella-like endosymbiont]|uniref:HAD-IA family hydrolase n=1 Tax=Coxiella-like endosymbiont TaxID=1592897 RepID=UPI00272CE8FC|nr:HAD-IA family hydrolase [Coxiella-like endosymbiont]